MPAVLRAAIFVPVNAAHGQMELRAVLFVLLAALGFGSLSVFVVLALRGGIPLLVVLQWRFALAALVLLIVLRRRVLVSTADRVRLLLVGLVGQSAMTFVSLSALHFIRPAALAFLFFTYPAWLAAGGALSGLARLDRVRLIALLLALGGIVVMLRPGSEDLLDPRGVALALGSALLYAAYLPTLSRVQTGVPSLVAAFYVILGAAIAYTIASLVLRAGDFPAGAEAWLIIGTLVIVSTVLAFAFLIAGVAVLGAVKTSIIGTAEPFFTAIVAYLLLGDPFRPATIAGGILIAAAVVLNARSAVAAQQVAPANR